MNAFYTRNQQGRSAGESLASLRWVCLLAFVLLGICGSGCDISPVPTPIPGEESGEFGAGLGEEFEDDFGPDDQLANRSPSLPPEAEEPLEPVPGGEEGGEMGFTDEGGTEVDENAEEPEAGAGGEEGGGSRDGNRSGTSEGDTESGGEVPPDGCDPDYFDTEDVVDPIGADAGTGGSDAGCD